MWNLSGDDIERAKAELTGRRAAIQAQYDNEIKQLAADLAALETFERDAVKFVANYKGQDTATTSVTGPGDSTSSATPVGQTTAAADQAPTAAEKGSSRWRMRLGTKEAADEP
jgi:hypothetical protein